MSPLSAPLKGRSRCYTSLHCDEYGHLIKWNIYNAGETLYMYRDQSRVVEFLLHFENKQRIMPNSGDSTQAHVFLIYW